MSVQAGWYPDPGGQQGFFRYWDGQSWSAALSSNPQAAAPSQGLVPQQAGPSQGGPDQGAYNAYGQQGGGAPMPAKKSPIGWWIGAGVIILALVVVAAFFVRGAVNNINTTPGGGVSAGPSEQLCPVDQTQQTVAPKQYNDGRVHGGALSFPRLPSPWGAPEGDTRVPFGRDVMSQSATVHPNYDATGNSWVASVLVAELIAGDGFFTPEQGSEIVVKCVTGTFYADAEVTREDKLNKATTVDGADAWIVESHLTFDIEGLPTKGELLIVVIVASDDAVSSLYYASIPDDSPEYVQPARNALQQLKVE